MNAAVVGVIALLLAQGGAPSVATIRGRVLNPDGQPMANVELRAMFDMQPTGRIGGIAMSDADGQFEIGKVLPGRIMLVAQPLSRREGTKTASHPPVYFPGVLDRFEAWPIDVKAGEIIELDFHLPPVFIGSIKAVVSGPDGHVLEQVRVMRPEANEIKNVKVSSDGVGHLDGLREGRYVVVARGRWKTLQVAAWQIVHITGGELQVALPLAPAAGISGRLVAEHGDIPPIDAFLQIRVEAEWTDGNISLDPLSRDDGYVAANGGFAIGGLFGRRRLRVVGLSDGWYVSAIRHGRSDITSSGIELAAGTLTEVTIVVSQR